MRRAAVHLSLKHLHADLADRAHAIIDKPLKRANKWSAICSCGWQKKGSLSEIRNAGKKHLSEIVR